MKNSLPILSLIAILPLMGCQTTREPAPGNELAEMVNHKDFQNVSANYPEFAAYCIRTMTKLEIEQAWANHKKMEATRALHRRVKQAKAPPSPPAPAKPLPSQP